MLRNGALPGRDSCDFSPKSDDSTQKCVNLSLAVETTEVPSFRSEFYGVPITFASPRSRKALLDSMVATIQAKDLRTCSVLVICQQSAEARLLKSEMGRRSINTMLLDAHHLATHNMVRLWSQGYIQQVLIACDDHLNLLEGICADFVIHTALPPVEKFKERLKMLSESKGKAEMLAFISDDPKEEIGNASGEEENGKSPQLVVKPVDDGLKVASESPRGSVKDVPLSLGESPSLKPPNDALEKASELGSSPRALTPENGSVKDVPLSLEESLNPVIDDLEKASEQGSRPRALTPENGSVKAVSISLEDSFSIKPVNGGLEEASESPRGSVKDVPVSLEESLSLKLVNDDLEEGSDMDSIPFNHTPENGSVKDVPLSLEESLFPKPVHDDLEEAFEMDWIPFDVTPENESGKDVLLSLEGSCSEESDLEGWITPPKVSRPLLHLEENKDNLNMLSKSGNTSDGPKEEIWPLPEVGNALDKEDFGEMPPLVPINPVKDDLEEDVSWSSEESDLEGWKTPPKTSGFMLALKKYTDNLKKLSLSANISDGPKEEILPLPVIENAFDDEENGEMSQLEVKPVNDDLQEASESPRGLMKDVPLSLEEPLSDESENEGWKTPPETPRFALALGKNTDHFNLSEECWSPRALVKENMPANDVPLPLEESLSDKPEVGTVVCFPRSRASSQDSVGCTNGQSSTAAPAIAWGGDGMTRAKFGVLVWSRDPIVPCYDISGVPDLNPSIRNTMVALMENMRDHHARGLQRYAWPHVASGKSLVAVGPEKVGKTWCFLPRLCQRTHELMILRPGKPYGPTSIVVSFNEQQGKQILQWIIELLDPLNTADVYPYKQVVGLWEKGNVKEAADTLRHSVGFLVTTPDMLALLRELHTKKRPIFHAKSIKCLVLDNLSDMMRHLPDTTSKMVEWFIKLLDFGADGCQLFVTTRLWPETLMRQSLLPLVPDVLVAFKDPLEATMYRKSSLEVNLVEPEQRIHALVKMLRGRSLAHERIVVISHTKEEVLFLKYNLLSAGIQAEAIYADGGLVTVTQWRLLTLAVVLLVTDDMVNKVNCGPIDQLIHYTPAISWMRFKFRFSLLYSNYVSSVPEASPGKAVVLLQQSDLDHLWLLAEFIMWHQQPRPDHWLRVLAASRQGQDTPSLELAKLALCEHLCSYGDCFRRTCRYRHVMWREEVQSPANYPTEGDFRFHVLTCNSPIQLAVRLNELYPTKINFLNTPMSQLVYDLHVYYQVDENRCRHVNPKVGEIVVVRNLKRFERAVITGVGERVVTVRLLDTGIDTLSYTASQIFICEEQHQNEPGQAMEVRVIGIEPTTLDRIWTKEMRDAVRTSFFSRLPEKRKRVFSASVKLVVSRTIFVETVFDEKGQDLRSFLLERFNVHEEPKAMEKLAGIVDASQPSPKES